jgi:hypothetical protein
MRIRDLATIAIIFVVAGIVLGIGADVLGEVETDLTAGAASGIPRGAVANASAATLELASWMPTIGLVIAAGLIITIIFASFGGKV